MKENHQNQKQKKPTTVNIAMLYSNEKMTTMWIYDLRICTSVTQCGLIAVAASL